MNSNHAFELRQRVTYGDQSVLKALIVTRTQSDQTTDHTPPEWAHRQKSCPEKWYTTSLGLPENAFRQTANLRLEFSGENHLLLRCEKIPNQPILITIYLESGLNYGLYKKKNKPYNEVLGAAQFTERTMQQCQKLSKVVISCHKLSLVDIFLH